MERLGIVPSVKSTLFLAVFYLTAMPLGSKETPVDAVDIFANHCARCHGANLEGGLGKSLVDGVWKFGRGSWAARQNIKFGIPDLGMPPFNNVLSDKEIRALVSFIRGQTKAAGTEEPALPDILYTQDYLLRVEVLADDLEIPWSVAFVDRKTLLVTERPGTLRVFHEGVLQTEPVVGTPAVLHYGQGGLMDTAVDPNYTENGWIYLSYTHQLKTETAAGEKALSMTRIVRGRIKGNTWTDNQVIYEAPHDTYLPTGHHYGCRIVFDPRGYLFFAIGDRGKPEHAQVLSRPNGKTHRIHRDGSVPSDNPFAHLEHVLPTIYSYGHRNPQGMAVQPRTGRIWITEHGPLGGDELNLISPGRNYGWPVISYGRNYDGTIITEFESRAGMEQPILYWKPSIAVCGLNFYRGRMFPKWSGKLLAGALKYEEVQLLHIERNRVIHRQIIAKNLGRVRDVAADPDGAIYLVLNGPDRLVRLTLDAHRN